MQGLLVGGVTGQLDTRGRAAGEKQGTRRGFCQRTHALTLWGWASDEWMGTSSGRVLLVDLESAVADVGKSGGGKQTKCTRAVRLRPFGAETH